MKKLIAIGIASLVAVAANAGPSGSSECAKSECAKAPVEVAEAPLGATLSAGYVTDYIFRGVNLGSNAPWVGLDYTLTALPVPVDLGVWYANVTDSDIDKLDLSASVAGPSFYGFDTSLAFVAYLYPESSIDTSFELALGISRSLGFVDWDMTSAYDFELDAWYFETGVSKGFDITDNIDLVLSTGIAYSVDYWAWGSDFNHVYVQAALPISLRSNVTVEPFIAGLFALDHIDAFQEDAVYGGVSLRVSF